MAEIKIGITILDKKENYIKTEPTIIGIGETFSISIEIDENSKAVAFDILCAPSSDGIAIYGIYDNIHKDKIGMPKVVK